MSRYSNRPNAINQDQLYEDVFEERGVSSINQFVTPEFSRPSQEVLDSMSYKKYVWTVGDRYWRIAQRQYGDRSLWYIIARFNNKPTEAHIQPGDLIKIPTNVRMAVEVLS
jgi:nucleoid-associated protein YgaU